MSNITHNNNSNNNMDHNNIDKQEASNCTRTKPKHDLDLPDHFLPKFDLRRQSETTTFLIKRSSMSKSSRSKSEITPPTTTTTTAATTTTTASRMSVENFPDNPFQNDQLPVWQHHRHHRPFDHSRQILADQDSTSSPETNQDQAYDYSYKSLYETPSSPELMKRRLTDTSLGSDIAKVASSIPGNGMGSKTSAGLNSRQPQTVTSIQSSKGDLTPQEPPEVIQVCSKSHDNNTTISRHETVSMKEGFLTSQNCFHAFFLFNIGLF